MSSTVSEDFLANRESKLDTFRKQRIKEDQERALEREVRARWCEEIFDHTNGEVELPWSLNYDSDHVTKYHDFPTKKVNEGTDFERDIPDYSAKREIDVYETEKLLRKIVQFARSKKYPVNYKYSDNDFTVTVTLYKVDENDITMKYHASRNVVCDKITKTIHHEETTVPAHDEVVEEWDCRKVSFLGKIPQDYS